MGQADPLAAPASVGPPGWRAGSVAAVVGLSAVAVLAPIAVALLAAANMPLLRPLAATALVGLLVLAPAGVGVAAALVGLQRIAAVAQNAGGEAELAVLRVLVATLLFGSALVLAAVPDPRDATAAAEALAPVGGCLPVAAFALVSGWGFLLCVLLWPVPLPPRRHAATVSDLTLLSLFLHFGGGPAAGGYPLYVMAVVYAGSRFGLAALLTTAGFATVGFTAVVLSTEVWRHQPALSAGLIATLVALPAVLAGGLRAMAAAQRAASQADAERRRTLAAIAAALRGQPATTAAAAVAAGAPGAASINDILDFAAIEAGTFAAPIETFDLRGMVRQSLTRLQAPAAERSIALRWRVDPRLPYRLRGHAQAVARILSAVAEHGIDAATTGATVRVTVDGTAVAADRVRLEVRVDTANNAATAADGAPLALQLAERLAAIAGGSFAIERLPNGLIRLAASLPLRIEAGAAAPLLDLNRRPVLIVTEDDELARDLAEPLATWNAEPRWPADAEEALAELAHPGDAKRAVVIVDGRGKLLSALGIAHQAARLGINAPFVLLIADGAQIATLGAVDNGELDGLIAAPVTEPLLANALDALPLGPERPKPRLGEPPPQWRRPTTTSASQRFDRPGGAPAADLGQTDAGRITPIAAHPKFAGETAASAGPAAATIDTRAIEGLRALGAGGGGGEGFLTEVIETFRIDARQIMQRIEEAATGADTVRFANGLVALRRVAGHLGGVQLAELTASLHPLTAAELRQHGSVYIQRLDAEINRLADAVAEFLAVEAAARGR